ncbi:MAG: segregation/condensation protein A, partial [Stellaceae bacterium]
AYGAAHRRQHAQVLTIMPAQLYSLDDGLQQLAGFIGRVPEWRELAGFLPEELRGAVFRRSAVAAVFAATLELARAGKVELRQDRPFGPLYLRSAIGR